MWYGLDMSLTLWMVSWIFINFLDLLRTHMDTSYWTSFGCLKVQALADLKEPWAKTATPKRCNSNPMTIVHVEPLRMLWFYLLCTARQRFVSSRLLFLGKPIGSSPAHYAELLVLTQTISTKDQLKHSQSLLLFHTLWMIQTGLLDGGSIFSYKNGSQGSLPSAICRVSKFAKIGWAHFVLLGTKPCAQKPGAS